MALLDKLEDVDNSIRVPITLVIHVDKEHWNTAYGTGTRAKEVSDDVRLYFDNLVKRAAVFDEIDGYVDAKTR